MAKHPGSPKNPSASSKKNNPVPHRPGKTSGGRRKFLKTAGVAAAGALLVTKAKGMVAPGGAKFTKQWLEMVRMSDVYSVQASDCVGETYYNGACCDCITSGPHDTGISIPTQQQSCWCWIAVGLGVAKYYNTAHSDDTQCTFLNSYLYSCAYVVDCCGATDNSMSAYTQPCNYGGPPGAVLDWLGVYNTSVGGDGRAWYPTVVGQINEGLPMVIVLQSSAYSQSNPTAFCHCAVISGYDCGPEDPGDPEYEGMVNIMDPWLGNCSNVRYCYIESFYTVMAMEKLSNGETVIWDDTMFTCPVAS